MVNITSEHYQTHIAPLIEACAEKECHAYWSIIRKIKPEDVDDPAKNEILNLFSAVTSYMLAPDSLSGPFKPVLIMDGRRSSIPTDLNKEQCDFLQQLLPEITDNELKARVADTLWVLKHGKAREHAEIAIEAYLAAADTLLKTSWSDSWQRLNRAFRISLQLRLVDTDSILPEKNALKKIFGYIESEKEADPPYLAIRLIELLHESRRAEYDRHAAILESIATSQETKNDYHTARNARSLAAKLHQQAKKTEDGLRCQVCAAETYVKQADIAEAGERASYMLICSLLQNAVEAYRYIPGQQQRRDEIYARLLQAQPNINNEMGSISTEVDISAEVKNALKAVSGHDVYTAVYNFAFLIHPPRLEAIQKEVEDLAQESPFLAMMPGVHLDRKGRVVAKSSADDSIESKMHRHIAEYHRHFYAKSMLIPALQQIRLEHHISIFEWASFLQNHPFVPPERVNTYAYGLFHGFHGDFLSAAHILIPQIENSIRYVLNNHERQTSKQIEGGIQEERSLNHTLVECKELVELFGKDLVFDLQGLLVKKEGENLRNTLMHGLLDDDQLFSSELVYLYWLTLHIIFIPLIRKPEEAGSLDSEE